jgi:hypothetical protein
MPKTLKQLITLGVGEVVIAAVNLTDLLVGESDTLTGTPTAVEQTSSDLTITNVVKNSAEYTERETGDTVAANMAVRFTVSGGLAGTSYTVRVTCTTTNGATLIRDAEIRWI